MGNGKVVFKVFTIPQYRQEEEFLSSMHREGWRLAKITFPGFYHFEKCVPRKVTYRLDYNQDGARNKTEYVQMFSDCGWDYLFDFTGYSYFCKEGKCNREEEIFCDDASRLDMMKRVFKGRIVPLIILFGCVILPQLFMNTLGYGGGSSLQGALSIVFLLLAVLYLAIFSVTAYQFYQYEKRLMLENTSAKYKYYGIFLLLILIVIGIGIFFYLSKRPVYDVSRSADGFMTEAGQLNTCAEIESGVKKEGRL